MSESNALSNSATGAYSFLQHIDYSNLSCFCKEIFLKNIVKKVDKCIFLRYNIVNQMQK